MKLLHIFFILFLALPGFSFSDYSDRDPRITISSPVEGSEFASGATVNVNLDVNCDCDMSQIMLTITNVVTGEKLLVSDITVSLADSSSGVSRSVVLPTVSEETDITIEIEVMDKDGEDLESEEITIAVMPK